MGCVPMEWKHILQEVKDSLKTYRTIKVIAVSAGGNDFAGLGDLDKIILNSNCGSAGNIKGCCQQGQPNKLFREVMGIIGI